MAERAGGGAGGERRVAAAASAPSATSGTSAAASSSDSELRADWLKLRGVLYDPLTRLPSLPVVLDDVRRRLEGDEPLGLVYLDLSSGGHSETACGWQAYDEVLRTAADVLHQVRDEVLSERDCLAQVGVRSDEFVLFVGAESRADLERLHVDLVARVTDALGLVGDRTGPIPPLQSALVPLHSDPTRRIERIIYGTLGEARELCRREIDRRHAGRLEELRRMLQAGDVIIRYQPIVDIERGLIHGYEALSAAPDAATFENPEMLFSFAEESESIVDLERLCRRQAVRRITGRLGDGGYLFLNCSAHAFADPLLIDDLVAGSRAAGFEPSKVVLEVTERVAITEWRTFRQALERVRGAGLRVAIDDMGSGYSSLRAVAETQPDYLKFDLSLIHGIHRSPIKRDLFEALVSLADKIGALAIAEGIEEPEEFETVRSMGVGLGQGFFFARPAEPDQLRPIHFPG